MENQQEEEEKLNEVSLRKKNSKDSIDSYIYDGTDDQEAPEYVEKEEESSGVELNQLKDLPSVSDDEDDNENMRHIEKDEEEQAQIKIEEDHCFSKSFIEDKILSLEETNITKPIEV